MRMRLFVIKHYADENTTEWNGNLGYRRCKQVAQSYRLTTVLQESLEEAFGTLNPRAVTEGHMSA